MRKTAGKLDRCLEAINEFKATGNEDSLKKALRHCKSLAHASMLVVVARETKFYDEALELHTTLVATSRYLSNRRLRTRDQNSFLSAVVQIFLDDGIKIA